MEHVHAKLSASISELKKNPSLLLSQADGKPIAILNHNKPTAYLIPAERYQAILEALENADLLELASQRLKEKKQAINVDPNDL